MILPAYSKSELDLKPVVEVVDLFFKLTKSGKILSPNLKWFYKVMATSCRLLGILSFGPACGKNNGVKKWRSRKVYAVRLLTQIPHISIFSECLVP